MKTSILLTILFLTFSVSAQKTKPKKKIKKLPTVYEVAPLRKPPPEEKPEWTHLTGKTSKDGKIQTVYSYQTNSLVQIAPHTYRFWIEAKEVEKTRTYRALLLLEANCQNQEYDFRRLIIYDKSGAVASDDNLDGSELSEVLPGTLSAAIFTKICAIGEK